MHADNKRIAKNTVYLYLRTGINLIIMFFSMRLLLKYLGVEDFGLYGLVGSVVALVESVKGLLSSSIQRFINVEIGRGHHDNVNRVFCTGLRINCVCAVVVAVVLEVLGYLIIPSLAIPETRLGDAFAIFHFSIATIVCTILTIPLEAVVIAYERFNAYAMLSIVQVCLKLLAVVMLLLLSSGRAVAYAGMLLVVALVIGVAYFAYCRRHFASDIALHRYDSRQLVMQMATFAGWQFVGSCSTAVSGSCVNFILNMFGGLAVNAARTIAYQVMTAVNVLVWNVDIGFTPQCISAYSARDDGRFYLLLCMQTKFTFFLSSTLGMAIAILAYPILKVWLGEVPPYAVGFVQVIFLYSIARSIHDPVSTIFSASGRQKAYQLSKFVGMLATLGLTYLLLWLGFPYWTALLAMALTEFALVAFALLLARTSVGFDLGRYFRGVISRCMLIMLMFCGVFAAACALPVTTAASMALRAALATAGVLLAYRWLFNDTERARFKQLILSKIKL